MKTYEIPVDGRTARMALSADGVNPMGGTRFSALKRRLGLKGRYVLLTPLRKFLHEHPDFSEQEVYLRRKPGAAGSLARPQSQSPAGSSSSGDAGR